MKHSTVHLHTEETHVSNTIDNRLKEENRGSRYVFVIYICLGIPYKSMEI